MSFTGGSSILIEADDTQGQQNPESCGVHVFNVVLCKGLLQIFVDTEIGLEKMNAEVVFEP